MNKIDLAKAYRDQYGMDMPTLKLARIMYRENQLLFNDLEAARYALRYIEGKGSGKRVKKNDPKYIIPERVKNPYNLPDSDEKEYLPYVISGVKRIVILTDIHLPYHNIEALTGAIKYAKDQKPDAILLNGDTIDCHTISRFIKDPKARDFKGELDAFKSFMNVLDNQLGCKVYFKLGNHEVRYQNFLYQKAGELLGIEEFEFENILKARAKGIEIIGDKTVMKLNKLNGIHGHEYIGGISAPVNTARGLYLRGKVSAFQGHTHQHSSHTEVDMNGKTVTTYSIGCLCELHPSYMPLNKWGHGMAVVDLDPNGEDYEFRNHVIIKGKVY